MLTQQNLNVILDDVEFHLPMLGSTKRKKLANRSIQTWGSPGGPVARLYAPNAGGLGSIPGQGTGSHILQLRPGTGK